jgi:hypothetical protein
MWCIIRNDGTAHGQVLKATAAWASAVKAVAGVPKQLTRVERAKLPTHYVLLVRWGELRAWARARGLAWPAAPTKQAAYDDFMRAKNASEHQQGDYAWTLGNTSHGPHSRSDAT